MAETKLGNKPFIVMLICSLIFGAIDTTFLVEPAWYYVILFTAKYFVFVVTVLLYVLGQNKKPCGVEDL
ncbi:hypothetical protein LCGC14_0176360 [marine sediment metagenome]|uniref:Uncharacterized protein n=1 Tax=marine sediment metagenome TaxID=412755 RepID=A0A0F9V7V4_9ZZZZ